jgi:gluconolactonase
MLTSRIFAATSVATGLLLTQLVVTQLAGQQPQGMPKGGFAQPVPPIDVTIAAIPGVIAGGAVWQRVWTGDATADGMTATKDGGLLMAQEQSDRINQIDVNDQPSVFSTASKGPGSVAFDAKGQVWVLERGCTDPGKPGPCTEPTSLSQLTPARKVFANSIGKLNDGKSMGRVNDFTIAKSGHMYITTGGVAAALHVTPTGEVTPFGENLFTNGITLSPDEKTLYITNRATIAAFDVQPDGSVKNQREFGKLTGAANGDGIAVDAEGRLYVTCNTAGNWGVQVLDKTGKYVGTIPTPRSPITLAFSGKDKKMLYIGAMGWTQPDTKEYLTAPNVRNVAMTVYKVPVLTPGFKGRMK